MILDPVQCNWCLQLVRADEVHSCWSAHKVADHLRAERAVITAAKAWLDVRHGPRDVLHGAAQRALADAVSALVALEGGA
jgi:hypothetical protein